MGILEPQPKPHTNVPIADSGYTGNYIYALTTIFNAIEPSENPIKVKLLNSSTILFTTQAQLPIKEIYKQANQADPPPHSPN